MLTHNGNIGRVVADIGRCTIETLERFNIPYDELCFGKPIADFYIDDKAINSKFDLEKATGYYNTIVAPRRFNKIIIDGDTVTKHGKIDGEIFWYTNMSESLKKYFPKIKSINRESIKMEKINGVPFSYLYVNCSLTSENFKNLLNSIDSIHRSESFLDPGVMYDNYEKKIKDRYETDFYSQFLNSNIVYEFLVKELKKYQVHNLGKLGIIHGDPVFTNVFLDINNDIKLIDPRGKIGSKLTTYGDIFYDYAKIYQSLIGYDCILNGKDKKSKYSEKFENIFEEYIEEKFSSTELNYIKLITCSHLFSLLPLHDDVNKNQKFYNLLYRLYLSIKEQRLFAGEY